MIAKNFLAMFGTKITINSQNLIISPQNITLTPFTTKLKTLGPTRNI
jgi:hypothetical protein